MNETVKAAWGKSKVYAKKAAKSKLKEVGNLALENPKVIAGIGIGAGLILAPQVTIAALLGAFGVRKMKFGRKRI